MHPTAVSPTVRLARRVSQERPYIQVSKVDRASSADRASSVDQVSKVDRASQVGQVSQVDRISSASKDSTASRGSSLRPHSRHLRVSSLRRIRTAKLLDRISSVSPMDRNSLVSPSEPNRTAHMLHRSSRGRTRLSVLQQMPMTRRTRRCRVQGQVRPTWVPSTHRIPSTLRANRRRHSASALTVKNHRGAMTEKQQFRLLCLLTAQAPVARMT